MSILKCCPAALIKKPCSPLASQNTPTVSPFPLIPQAWVAVEPGKSNGLHDASALTFVTNARVLLVLVSLSHPTIWPLLFIPVGMVSLLKLQANEVIDVPLISVKKP